MPEAQVRLSAGREAMSDELQALAFLAGANSIFSTASGCSPPAIRTSSARPRAAGAVADRTRVAGADRRPRRRLLLTTAPVRRTADAVALALGELDRAQLRRVRQVVEGHARPDCATRLRVAGRELLNFLQQRLPGSRARSPRCRGDGARERANGGAGSSGAAHLVTGHTRAHHDLEAALADFTGREAALLFSTGYMANLGAITAFADRGRNRAAGPPEPCLAARWRAPRRREARALRPCGCR